MTCDNHEQLPVVSRLELPLQTWIDQYSPQCWTLLKLLQRSIPSKGTFMPKMLYCDTSLLCTLAAYIATWMSKQTYVLERECSYRKMLYCDNSRSTWRLCAMPAEKQKKFVFPRGRHPGSNVDSAVIGWIKVTSPSALSVLPTLHSIQYAVWYVQFVYCL